MGVVGAHVKTCAWRPRAVAPRTKHWRIHPLEALATRACKWEFWGSLFRGLGRWPVPKTKVFPGPHAAERKWASSGRWASQAGTTTTATCQSRLALYCHPSSRRLENHLHPSSQGVDARTSDHQFLFPTGTTRRLFCLSPPQPELLGLIADSSFSLRVSL